MDTKAVTADDLKANEIQQFDFRSNLKKSKTSENLTDMCDEDEFEFKTCLTSELEEKLSRRLLKSETVDETTYETATEGEPANGVCVGEENRLGEMEGEMSKSRNSVYSLASSSSKASTVHPLVAETGESVSSADSGSNAAGHKPTIISGISDTCVLCGETFSLQATIENADEVVWTLENEEIEAEPEEGLILKQEGM